MTPDFYELLASRRMRRAYLPREVPRPTLLKLLDAARRAPSAGHAQGVRFGVVTELEQRRAIARRLGEDRYRAKGFPGWLSGAPVQLFVGVSLAAYAERYAEPDKQSSPELWPIDYRVLDAGKALMALYLAAERERLACGYLGPHRATPALELLPWPDDWRFVGLVTTGYPDLANHRPSRSHQRGWRDLSSVAQWWDRPGP